MYKKKHLHIALTVLAFLVFGALMNLNSVEFIEKRPPLYVVFTIQITCTLVDLLILEKWRQLRIGLFKYVILFTVNFAICASINALFGFEIVNPIIFRMALAMTLIFTIAEQSELSRSRKAENLRLSQEKERAELAMLQQQLNPHFLFNSLNTLKGFIEEDQKSAIDYLHRFSEVYRYVLANRDQNLVPLEEELILLQEYYGLLKARFGNRLKVEIDVTEQTRQKLVPPMALQLLLENAIKHNEVSKLHPLSLSIRSEGDNLIVENPVRVKKSFVESNGLGLKNLNTRLSYANGKELKYGLDGNNNTFQVILPLS